MSDNTYGQLTETQRNVIAEFYKNGRDRKAAYIKIFPKAAAWSKHILDTRVRKFFAHKKVQAVLRHAEIKANETLRKHAERYAVSEANIEAGLANLAFTNVDDIMTWDENGVKIKPSGELSPEARAAITEVSAHTTKVGEVSKTQVRVKLVDKQKPLETLAKIKGMFKEPENTGDKKMAVFIIENGDGKAVEHAVGAVRALAESKAVVDGPGTD